MLVVGFLGKDATLGRTFMVHDQEEVQNKLQELLEENEETKTIPENHFEDNCVFETDNGFYFVGGLES